MKRSQITAMVLLLAGLALIAVHIRPRRPASAPAEAPRHLPVPAGKDTLTEDEIRALRRESTDQAAGRSVEFQLSVQVPALDDQRRAAYKASGRIPFQVFANLVESKQQGGRTLYRRLDGTIHFYVTDATGATVIAKVTLPLDRMCPS